MSLHVHLHPRRKTAKDNMPFEENKHPRAGGKFAAKGGGGIINTKATAHRDLAAFHTKEASSLAARKQGAFTAAIAAHRTAASKHTAAALAHEGATHPAARHHASAESAGAYTQSSHADTVTHTAMRQAHQQPIKEKPAEKLMRGAPHEHAKNAAYHKQQAEMHKAKVPHFEASNHHDEAAAHHAAAVAHTAAAAGHSHAAKSGSAAAAEAARQGSAHAEHRSEIAINGNIHG